VVSDSGIGGAGVRVIPSVAAPPRPDWASWVSTSNDVTGQFLAAAGQPGFVSLAGGLPAADLYPVEAVAAASARALDRWGGTALEYGPVEGFPALRAAIAERMSRATGGSFRTENVLLTTGAMQGLDLLGKVLLDSGDLVVAQFPTYLGALDTWRTRTPRYERLSWDPAQPNADTTLRRAKFVYAVPNFSNPTGVLVPQDQRAALLERVTRAGTWLVEDDPYLALQLDGPAGPGLLDLDVAARGSGPYDGPVVYLGTLSKSIAPGLRIGWAVAGPEMIRMLALAKQCSDLSSSMYTHAVALELLDAHVEEAHVPAIVACYRERRDAMYEVALAELGAWFLVDRPSGGMFLWAEARHPGMDTDALYRRALAEGVAFVPSSVFDPDGMLRTAMRLNFTRNSPDVMAEGVRRLARAIRAYLAEEA
jgi:2-aminoadipate transaminase